MQRSGARVEHALDAIQHNQHKFQAQTLDALCGISDQLAQSHAQLSNELNVVKAVTEAVLTGVNQIQDSMKLQTQAMLHVMELCESLQAGQHTIVHNQELIMRAIVSNQQGMLSQFEKVLMAMRTNRVLDTLEKFKVLSGHMARHLRDTRKTVGLHAASSGQGA